jgi:uroporphyrinogen decarboxylase
MREMSPRERLLTSLRHEEPDRVPLDLGGLATTIETVPYNELKKYLGIKKETKLFLRDHVDPPKEVIERFGIDTRYVRLKTARNFKVQIEHDNSYLDEWGTRWKKPESSFYYDPVDWPLKDATIKDLETYRWPDPHDPGRTEGLREEAQRLRENRDYAIIADTPVLGIFESATVCLRGIERLMMDLILDKPFAKALFDKLADLHIEFFRHYLEAVGDCIDVVMVSDDLGGENGPLISPELYRELIKPAQKKLWQFIKSNTEAYLFLHSCGSIYRFIPDLVEMGVDILNPIQVAAKDMDTRRLKEEFGDKLTFWGGIDTQRVLPFGSPGEVESEVKKRIADMAPGGGYVLTAVHNIQAGVPPENICMMYDAARRWGTYPIDTARLME